MIEFLYRCVNFLRLSLSLCGCCTLLSDRSLWSNLILHYYSQEHLFWSPTTYMWKCKKNKLERISILRHFEIKIFSWNTSILRFRRKRLVRKPLFFFEKIVSKSFTANAGFDYMFSSIWTISVCVNAKIKLTIIAIDFL